MVKSVSPIILRLFYFGFACLMLGACAESGTKRTKVKTQSNSSNSSNTSNSDSANKDQNGSKGKETEDAEKFAGLSLSEQCTAKGEGFVYSESEKSCFKIIDKKTSEEVCQSVDKVFLEGKGTCASVSKKQKLADACSEKGANYQYNSVEDICYEVNGTPTSINELCTGAGENVEFDTELMLCRVFSSVQDLDQLCAEASGTVTGTDCVIAEDNKTLTELCDDKGIGFFLHPSVDEPQTCNSVSQLIPANGICLAQGEATHVYNQEDGTCETINDKQNAQDICSSLGNKWEFSASSDECIEQAGEQSLVNLCKGPAIRCIYLDDEEKWGIISEETSAKSLCEARGSDYKFNDKGQCEHKDGEIILKDGTRVLKDGTKILPDGTKVSADGEVVLPDGTKILPDGTKVLPDGTRVKPDGTVLDKGGNPIEKDENGNVTLPDGSVVSSDGTVTKEDGTVISPDGTVTLPDGTKILPDGTTVLPDDTRIEPDGKTTLPDGTEQKPGNSGSTPEETLENGQIKKYSISIDGKFYDGKGQRYALANGTYASWLDRYDDHYGDKSSHPKDYWADPQIVRTIELKCPIGFYVKQIQAERTYVVVENKVGEYINWISLECSNLDVLNIRNRTVREGFNVTGQTSTISCGGEIATGLGSAVYEVFPKNFELECAPFNQFDIESGDKDIDLSQRLFTGRGLFNNDAIGERRYFNSCNDNFTKNRILTGLKFAVDMSNKAGDYWVPLWIDPLCSEMLVLPE